MTHTLKKEGNGVSEKEKEEGEETGLTKDITGEERLPCNIPTYGAVLVY